MTSARSPPPIGVCGRELWGVGWCPGPVDQGVQPAEGIGEEAVGAGLGINWSDRGDDIGG